MGTRFLPATKALPKELLPIIDTPALQLVLDECAEAGIDHEGRAIDPTAALAQQERHDIGDFLRLEVFFAVRELLSVQVAFQIAGDAG